MKLTVATNWDIDLIEPLTKLNVESVFGVMDKTPVGAGRPSLLLAKVDEPFVKDYVQSIHDANIKFNYLLNAPCMSNMEYDREVHHELIEHINWLNNINVDSVTISNPYIMEIVKEQFPGIAVNVSVISHVNSVQRAKLFEELGVDAIALDFNINRDFKLLKKIKSAVKCKLTILVNDGCLYQCPFRYYHYNIIGHASQTINPLKGFYVDYCIIRCTMKRFRDAVELIKGRWVRPEDLQLYEELSIDHFKISGRRMSTNWLTNTATAYNNRKYDGNLADLLNISQLGVDPDVRSPQYQAYLSEAKLIKEEKIVQIGQIYPVKPFIDNNKLDGFIDFFNKQDCLAGCNDCNYCQQWADKAVSIDQNDVDKYVTAMSALLKDLTTSNIFKEDSVLEVAENIVWDSGIKPLMEEIIQSSTPDEFKEVALMTITKAAEQSAKDRTSKLVEKADLVNGFIAGTPKAFHEQMRSDLKARGIEIDKYH
jgi:collagenase-like PrtC family protease